MRWRWRLGLVCFATVLPAAWAQGTYATDPLAHGRLRVWVVMPAPPAQPTADQVRATLHQSTAGDFGHTAGSVGQTSGDYGGGTAGDMGHPASLESQTAGSYGQTAGSLGQTAGSVGQTAGSYGVAAGELGSVSAQTEAGSPGFLTVPLDGRWTTMIQQLRSDFPGLKVDVLAVSKADLAARLVYAGRGRGVPDVLLSDPGVLSLQTGTSPVSRTAGDGLRTVLRQATVVLLGSPALFPQGSSGFVPPAPPEAAPLVEARDPAEARAFVVWLRDGMRAHWEEDWIEQGAGPDAGPEASEAASVAVGAAEALLQGGDLGAAVDPAIARFQPSAAQLTALRPGRAEILDGSDVQVDVLRAAANERFAVVMLRAIVGSGSAFGVVHPLVVLRRGTGETDDLWHVLQITPDLAPDLLQDAFANLLPSTRRVTPQQVVLPVGATLAAPVDGDVRPALPELWWDNGGSDRLLVVEWMDGQAGSHLFFVPDRAARLQTRVSALFAARGGAYRWRVWAVGTGGLVKLSGWRQFSVVR